MSDTVESWLSRAETARQANAMDDGLAAASAAWAAAVDEADRLRAGTLKVFFHYRRGELLQVLDDGLVVLPLVQARGSGNERFDLMRMVALAACDTGRFDIALPLSQQAYALALELGDDGRIAQGLNVVACGFERMGDPWQAERLMNEALQIARRSGQVHPLLMTLNNLLAVLLGMYHLLRDAVAAEESHAPLHRGLVLAREARDICDALGDPFFKVFIDGNLGEVLAHLGLAAEAQPLLEDTLALATRAQAQMQVWRIGCTLGELALLQGQADQAWDQLTAVLRDSGGTDAPVTHLRLHYALWHAAKARRRPADALYHLEQYLQLERQRALRQLKAQSELLVTRAELHPR